MSYLYGIGTAGNVGVWNGSGWDNKGEVGGWTLKCLTFDESNTPWCVGTASNVGRWNGSGWDNQGELGGWTLAMLAFARPQISGIKLYCVGTGGNIGYLPDIGGASMQNAGFPNVGGNDWTLSSVFFAGQTGYAVGTAGNICRSSGPGLQGPNWTDLGMDLKTFHPLNVTIKTPEQTFWAAGADNNVGIYDSFTKRWGVIYQLGGWTLTSITFSDVASPW